MESLPRYQMKPPRRYCFRERLLLLAFPRSGLLDVQSSSSRPLYFRNAASPSADGSSAQTAIVFLCGLPPWLTYT